MVSVAVIGVACLLGVGCAAAQHEADDGPRPEDGVRSADPLLAGCSSKIDAQIEAGLVPGADREYATGMCLQVP